MPNTAQSTIEEVVDQITVPQTTAKIYAFIGKALRGPINSPDTVIYTDKQYEKIYGGLVVGNDFPLLCQRALQRGAALRVCNIRHYTSISNASTLDAVLAVLADSDIITLSSPLTSDHTMQVTVNGQSRTQAYNTSSKKTLELLGEKIQRDLPSIVERAIAIDGLTLLLVPKTAVTLTTTSTPTGTAAPSATVESTNTINDGTDELFRLKPKARGADYNNLAIFITDGLNGDPLSFNINIVHLLDGTTETYENLKIPGKPNVGESKFLEKISKNSNLVEVEYLNLTAATEDNLKPLPSVLRFKNGSDGSAITANDIIGSSTTKTGAHSFDEHSDIRWIAVPDSSDPVVHQALANYVDIRKDISYHGHLSNASTTEDSLITERANANVDSSRVRFFAGGIKIIDPITREVRGISEMGDVAGIIASSANTYGAHMSSSGFRRGLVTNALGVVNNFGAVSNIINLNRLANRQINTVIVREDSRGSKKTVLWGNFTASTDTTPLRFANIRELLHDMAATLRPVADFFLEEPNEPVTWAKLWTAAQPYMEGLKDKRALYDYRWMGDQDVTEVTDDKLQVNTVADLEEGIYNVQIWIRPINSIQWIRVQIVIGNSAVSFEESVSDTTPF